MTVEIIVGTGLVLVTWAVAVVVLGATGMAPAVLTSQPQWSLAVLRRGIWWGLAITVVVVLAISLWYPLRSGGAASIFVLVIFCFVVWGVLQGLRSRRQGRSRPRPRFKAWHLPILVALALGTGYLAVAALGPVTNYDSGLYHLGAIAYAGDYASIPGLANLYFPFGYANSEFPLAAFLGNGPWAGGGFRLLNGLMLVAGAVDLVVRLLSRRTTVGTFVLMAGLAAAWVPMVALSDYWVTSPTSDSAVLALTIVAVSYLADALSGRRAWTADAAVAVTLSFVLVSLRPTMLFFALPTIGVVLVWGWRTHDSGAQRGRGRWAVGLVALLGTAGGVVIVARDYLLSGWLQYPLSVLAFPVDWRAPDPVGFRTATLGAARDPSDLWNAAAGWDWVGAWLATLPRQWETYAFITMASVAVFLLLLAHGRGMRVKALLLLMVPSIVAVVAWWMASPPSFRFIWGPLFTIATITIGWCGSVLYRSRGPGRLTGQRVAWAWSLGVGLSLILVTVYSAGARLQVGTITAPRTMTVGTISLSYAVTPIPDAPTRERVLDGGLRVLIPTESDQCWNTYPLCTAQLDGSVGLRGPTLQEGFHP